MATFNDHPDRLTMSQLKRRAAAKRARQVARAAAARSGAFLVFYRNTDDGFEIIERRKLPAFPTRGKTRGKPGTIWLPEKDPRDPTDPIVWPSDSED